MDVMEIIFKQLQTVIETLAELVCNLTNKLTAAVSSEETRTYRDVASASTSREEAFPGLYHQAQHGEKCKTAILSTRPLEKVQNGNIEKSFQ